MNDYCDGEIFASHPLFSVHKDALQIFLYFDELETANPLGSKAKIHKLGSVFDVNCLFSFILQAHFTSHLKIYSPNIGLA